ncbi:ligase-associated DNA damage response endonuclease PdeM [Aquisalimonas sp. 2447]|uniref:ligase-associated DNA damage response endonuclease PdeM n=1 Tax=Aquisalimonas sp. 2447 TaxID=2740807 RepID=UPI0014325A46|nr:ligase-associated DNA damage response endonuclease PdeM [Aquisalimonas sp. 2447]QIT54030.1 ligase-associated DNA damage response endonuclease PdeM [Aquisalimonas sp. 2447]
MVEADSDTADAAVLTVTVAGEQLELWPGRAAYWPRRQTLLLADPHFGKAGVFRRRGVPLPRGTTGGDLHRLAWLLQRTGARRLMVLGDFLHAAPLATEPWLREWSAWREQHGDVAIHVVAGNHDQGGAPADLDIQWHHEALVRDPFVLAHEPEPDPRGYVLAGHLHPVFTLRGGGDRLRFPVFWFREAVAVFPAFGAFTGGHGVEPGSGDRVFAAGETALVDCTARR